MGRIRIKKKGAVLPFRQTVAYRFLIVVAAALLFLIAVFQALSAYQSDNTPALIFASIAGAAAVILAAFNFSRMQTAKVPKQTLQRMKRR